MHSISAFVHSQSLRDPILDQLPSYQQVSLGHGLVLVPATDQLFSELHGRCVQTGGRQFSEFRDLTPAGVGLLETLSLHSPVAYIETEYFGGSGDQVAMLFRQGHLALGPLRESSRQGGKSGPINSVLRELGVRKRGAADEFEAVGLDGLRSMEEWEES